MCFSSLGASLTLTQNFRSLLSPSGRPAYQLPLPSPRKRQFALLLGSWCIPSEHPPYVDTRPHVDLNSRGLRSGIEYTDTLGSFVDHGFSRSLLQQLAVIDHLLVHEPAYPEMEYCERNEECSEDEYERVAQQFA